ncbi:MAG: hypothetical protein SwStaBPW_28540 [Shewanella algae]
MDKKNFSQGLILVAKATMIKSTVRERLESTQESEMQNEKFKIQVFNYRPYGLAQKFANLQINSC